MVHVKLPQSPNLEKSAGRVGGGDGFLVGEKKPEIPMGEMAARRDDDDEDGLMMMMMMMIMVEAVLGLQEMRAKRIRKK